MWCWNWAFSSGPTASFSTYRPVSCHFWLSWLVLCGGVTVSALGHSSVVSWWMPAVVPCFPQSLHIGSCLTPVVEGWPPALGNLNDSILIFIKVHPFFCVEHVYQIDLIWSGFGLWCRSVKEVPGESPVMWDASFLRVNILRSECCMYASSFPRLVGHGLVNLVSH